MSPAKIIATAISNQFPNWIFSKNLFIGREPEKPDSACTVFDMGGSIQNPKFADDVVECQVRIKTKSYDEGFSKIEEISLFLNGISPFNIEDERVEGIWLLNPIMPIGRDKTDHSIFTLNIRVLITPSQTGNRSTY